MSFLPKKTSRPRRPSASARRPGRRVVTPFRATAVLAFVVASAALNPQWLDSVPGGWLGPLETWLRHEAPPPAAVVSNGYAQTQFAECPHFFPEQRPPRVPAVPALRELCYSGFAILHNGQTKTPVFVVERLNRQRLEEAKAVPRQDRFFADARLPKAERAELADYRGSGYSRGHMAPAANMATPEAMAQSFSLANMVPQNQEHNGGAWARVEEDTRHYVTRAAGDVYVFTGPVYQGRPETIGAGRVAVPTQLYKLVYDPSTGRSWVHWQDNAADARTTRPISYDEFVRRTGLALLPSATP